MGRHGGGSRSGGSSGGGSRSSGGSRSGGSGVRASSTPFWGSYNRSYYDRRGRYHSYYTTNRNFGIKRGWSFKRIVGLVLATGHMLLAMYIITSSMFLGSKKVHGDVNRIFIEDSANILTGAEEQKILEVFREVYDTSGMPITLYTDDFEWKRRYRSLEAYSEELYYKIGMDEDAMLILFTQERTDGFTDWEYDMYCGDDTIKCFSDRAFNILLDNFQKSMSRQNLAEALRYSWNSVMGDLASFKFSWDVVSEIVIFIGVYAILYIVTFGPIKKQADAYEYFKSNPDKLSSKILCSDDLSPTTKSDNVYSSIQQTNRSQAVDDGSATMINSPKKMYSRICGYCGISSDGFEKTCVFCGADLEEIKENATV